MLQDNDSSKAGARVKPEVTDHAKTFAEEFAKLPEDQKAALTGEGLALNKLPDALRQIVQQTFEASIPNNPFATPTNMSTLEWLAQHAHTSQIRNGTFVLDPNSLVRVNVTEIEGAAHYTVTTKASFLINLLAKND